MMKQRFDCKMHAYVINDRFGKWTRQKTPHMFYCQKIGHVIKDCHAVLLQKSRLNSNPT
jgi:hypothetical protein